MKEEAAALEKKKKTEAADKALEQLKKEEVNKAAQAMETKRQEEAKAKAA